jgi:hypothetical protein
MDLKGRDPVKKAACALLCLLTVLSLACCKKAETPQQEAFAAVDYLSEFKTEKELASYLWSEREGRAKAFFARQETAGDEGCVIVYSPGKIPDGYVLESIELPSYSSFVTYRYQNGDREFAFVWGFLTAGEEYLKNVIESLELSPVEGLEGVWGSEFTDDAGSGMQMIYFARDGYCFQVNVAKEALNAICENGTIAVRAEPFPVS